MSAFDALGVYIFIYLLCFRRDTRQVPVANFAESFPAKFMDSRVFQKAREVAAVLPRDVPVSYLKTATGKSLQKSKTQCNRIFKPQTSKNICCWKQN